MMTIASCLPTDIDPFYILTALVVSCVGAWLTSSLFHKASAADGKKRRSLVAMTGMTGGCTIWTTHFVSMLGMRFQFSHAYAFSATLASLVIAVLVSGFAFHVASLRVDLRHRLAAGVILGLGIAAMHFVGMIALDIAGAMSFEPAGAALACFLGVTFASAALCWQLVYPKFHPKATMAVLFVVAIGSLHYTGMASLTITPGASTDIHGALNDRTLFAAVLFMTAMIMTFGSAAYTLDTQNSADRLVDMERKAYSDALTKLPNRAKLEDTLETMIALRKMTKATTPIAVVNFDLNRFKDINDVHGHAAGDAVLREVATRLKAVTVDGEFVSRVGGDEFIAFTHKVRDRQDAEAFAVRLREAILPDIEYRGKRLSVGSSLGVSIYPEDAEEIEDLFSKADLAMYRGKRDRLGVPVFYDSSIDDENRTRAELSIDLRKALTDGEFELCYQKQNEIVHEDFADREVLVGYEVLLRWNHPEHGSVSPEIFIPIAERDGMINAIGEWVIFQACREAANWAEPMKIAVNVAARQLSNDELPGVVRRALAESGLDSSMLEIEITESGIIADVSQAHKIVAELKALGVSIVMDDFGTGYSSLSTLQSFPFDKIKIDKGFISNLTTSRQSQAIVRSTIVLGKALKIAVLAEGVETREDVEFLRKEGCSQVQGFLFGKPIPSELMPTT